MFTIDVPLDDVRRGLVEAALRVAKAGNAAIGAAGAIVLDKVTSDSSQTGVSLRQLAKLDHPYARRHGSIQAGALGGLVVARPWIVHRRQGRFANAISGRYKPSLLQPEYDIELDGSIKLVRWIVHGTKIMLPRDVLGGVAADPVLRARVIAVVGSVLRSELAP